MSGRTILTIVAGALVAAYMVYILTRVIRSRSFTWKQKLAQTALIVFVPLFGAMIVQAVLRTDTEEPAREDKNFEKQDIGAL